MPIPSVELVLFAAQAGIRLVQTGRKVYVEATIGGEVEVPLPTAFEKDPLDMAINCAKALQELGDKGDAKAKERFSRGYADPLDKAYNGTDRESDVAKGLLVQQYLADVAHGLVPSMHPNTAGMAAIVVIRQWGQGVSPFPSAFQRIAGSLVEISIDYFLNVPGALNEDSRQGKALKSFLRGLAVVDFDEARWDAIAISLFTTALDTLKEHPDLITDEADDQSLVQKIVAGVASDVSARMQTTGPGNLKAEENLKRFSQIVLRSLLKNGGTAIIESPSRLVDSKGGQAMVQSVGSAFLDLLLDDGNVSLAEGLRKVASTEGFDRLVFSALKAAVEHPDDFGTGNEAVNRWLKDVLSDLYKWSEAGKKSLNDPELFVEIAYCVLDNGLRDLPVLLPPGNAASTVLVDIAHRVFDVLTDPPAEGKPPVFKSLRLSRSDLKNLFDGVFASLVANSPWLLKRPELQKEAVTLIPLVVAVLGDLDRNSLKALIRSDQLSRVVAAVLASEVLAGRTLQDKEKIAGGVRAVLRAVLDGGANGAEVLLDPDTLCDLLTALASIGAADRLLGDKSEEELRAMIGKLKPIFETLRHHQVVTLNEMVTALKAA